MVLVNTFFGGKKNSIFFTESGPVTPPKMRFIALESWEMFYLLHFQFLKNTERN